MVVVGIFELPCDLIEHPGLCMKVGKAAFKISHMQLCVCKLLRFSVTNTKRSDYGTILSFPGLTLRCHGQDLLSGRQSQSLCR